MQDNRLGDSLGYALVRLFRRVNRETGRALAPYKLSAEQAHILLVLWLDGPIKIGELAKSRCGVSSLARVRCCPDSLRALGSRCHPCNGGGAW